MWVKKISKPITRHKHKLDYNTSFYERKHTYQQNSSLWKVSVDVITDILGHTIKLIIIKPLIGMKIAHDVHTCSGIMLLYLKTNQAFKRDKFSTKNDSQRIIPLKESKN